MKKEVKAGDSNCFARGRRASVTQTLSRRYQSLGVWLGNIWLNRVLFQIGSWPRTCRFSPDGAGQQHGRRFPALSSVLSLSIRRCLVSAFLASSTQQIHSLRARGVMSSHKSSAARSSTSTLAKSSGRLCTTPAETSLADMLMCFISLPLNESGFLRNLHGAEQPAPEPVQMP